jgi:hypothetical protein
MSTRVAWATLQPAETEHVVSVMLCRENPTAMRIRPSRGDGGIDVITATAGGWVVDQIKYFSASLTPSQKTQVRESFERLRVYAAAEGARIAQWHLVAPVDATNEERRWFDGLTSEAGFPCEWRGLTHVEGLAAAYPDVIDYYLRDGKDRLATLVGQLGDVIRLGYRLSGAADTAGQPLAPGEIETGLMGLYAALNAHDPHYRYSFSVDAQPPEVPNERFLVAAVQRTTGIACVTFRIHARFTEAVRERPVPMTVQFRVPSDGPEAEAIRSFNDFGAPLTVEDPDGEKIEWSIDLPGGLGGAFQGGQLSLGPARTDDAQPYRLRVQILTEAGEEIGTCVLEMEPVTIGPSGSGVRAVGTEEHGVFGLEWRTDLVAQRVDLKLTGHDLTGKHPTDVLPGLRVAASFHPPNRLRFAAPYGPITHPADPLPGAIDLGLGPVLRVVEALAVIQDHTAEQITIPDLTTVTRSSAGDLIRLARLLQEGSVMVEWDHLDLNLEVPKEMEAVPVEAGAPSKRESIQQPCVVRLGDREIVLGSIRYELAAARVESVTPTEAGVVQVRLVPGNDRTARLVFEPPPVA